MNLGKASIQYKTSVLVLTAVFLLGGLLAYSRMGRLEDPEFTLKQAQVITAYPGATPIEVEQQVTEVIEVAIQQLGQVDYVESVSSRGRSQINVTIKDNYNKNTLPQVWDELRRKVNDAQKKLPPGAGPSMVVDDFGDVYGVFFALTGDGYSLAEIKQVAKYLQRELLTVQDVAKIELVGVQPEVIMIELSPARMSQFGISREQIYSTLQNKNLVVDAGVATVGPERIAIRPTGMFKSPEDFNDLLIVGGTSNPENQSSLVYLRDIATIKRDYQDPPTFMLRVDGQPAVGLAISTVKGGNVVVMGEALKARMEEIVRQRTIPFGIQFHPISIQSEAVTAAISGFVNSLFQAVVIVIVVLLLFMGLKSGLIIGLVLLITIIGSFVFMYGMGIMLERISLGALIIALGMLVDNAIVITEGMLIRIQRGEDKSEAAGKVVGQNAMPLLAATLVAILAFAAIGASNDSSGEYTRSLFLVIMISLLFSWLTAVTITPLFCAMLFRTGKSTGDSDDVYSGFLFRWYRSGLVLALRHRPALLAVMIMLLVASIVGFGHIETAFFPSSTRPQVMLDLWLPEGTDIRVTEQMTTEAESILSEMEHVTHVASFIGQGPPRYLLTLAPESPNTSYSHLLISVESFKFIDHLTQVIQTRMEEAFPEAIPQVFKFALGPGEPNKIQIRIQGPEITTLRSLASSVMDIMHNDGGLIGIQSDWRDKVKEYAPQLLDYQSRRLGIERPAVANLIKETFDGRTVGVYMENDELLPITVRAGETERINLGILSSLQIQSPATGGMIPLSQIVSGYETDMIDSRIRRRDRTRTITVKSNPRRGNASVALARLMPQIDAIELPNEYTLEYGGEYESSKDANAALQNKVLFCGFLMVLIVILLFNNLRQPLIIWLCVPLSVIGVTVGLLGFNQPFGFMALLGLLSLSGMLIKNAIVLIDEINIESQTGKPLMAAIIDSGVSRMRPVMMAASTTVLGMLPLVTDAFFVSMAVTIMVGLSFATVLTLVVVPVLYSIFYRAGKP